MNTFDDALDTMLKDKRDLREAVRRQEGTSLQAPLHKRHLGMLGRAAEEINTVVPKDSSRRAFLLGMAASLMGSLAPSVFSNVLSDIITEEITGEDDFSPSGWAVSPKFARLVTQRGYADKSFFSEATSRGDLALVDSINYHGGLSFKLLSNNIDKLEKSLANTSDADARIALQSRIMTDANLLNESGKAKETLRDISSNFDSVELTNATIVRLLDYGSSVALNCADGRELKVLDVDAFKPILAIYSKTAFCSMGGDFRELIPEFGLGIWALIQAHYVKRMQALSPDSRHDLREEWLESIMRHLEAAVGAEPEARVNLTVDSIYSMTRIAYSAALDGSDEQAKRIVSAAMYEHASFDRMGCAEAKALIRSRPLVPNSQWLRLLDVKLELKNRKYENAQSKMKIFKDRREMYPNTRTPIVSLERGFNELNAFAFKAPPQDVRFQELPEIRMNRAYLDALSG